MTDIAEFREAMSARGLQYQDLLHSSLEVDPPSRVAGSERPPEYKVTATWTIKGSDSVRYSKPAQLPTVRSPSWRVGPRHVRLVMFPMGRGGGLNRHMALYVTPACGLAAPIRGRLRLVVDRRYAEECPIDEEAVGEHTAWGFDQMCPKAAFVSAHGKGNRTLSVECSLTVESERRDVVGRHGGPGAAPMQDFSSILASGLYSDVTLSAGGREMRAHRNVLAARSPVFAAMFEADMSERHSGVVDIADADADSVGRLLTFAYTGEFDGSEGSAVDLLQLADKYGIEELKLRCAGVLCHQVDKCNALNLLVLAERYQLKRLLKIAFRFIESRWMYIRSSDEWTTLKETRPDLAFYVEALRSKEA